MTETLSENHRNILKGYNMLLYFAGTMIMFDPSHECIFDFWTGGILKKLPVKSSNPRFIKAASQLRASVEDVSTNYEKMKEDYIQMFSGREKSLAPPFESVYRSNDHLMFSKPSLDVRDFYQSYGWISKFKNKIPDDHLGIELLFLTIMIEKYLELDDSVCNIEMRKEIMRFINEHILSWVPQWNDNIQQNAITTSYKGIGTLIHACIEDIYSLMAPVNQ
jgi:putative dimethyl sulfoxide reductase chaperone